MKQWLTIFVVVLVVSFTITAVARADSTQLNALATAIAGTPATVSCYVDNPDYPFAAFTVLDSADGHAFTSDGVIYMRGEDCGALQNVLTPGPRTNHWLHTFEGAQDVGWAFHNLVHEAMHIRLLSPDEGLVECTAARNDYTFSKLLGLSWKLRNAVASASLNRHNSIRNADYRSYC